MVCANARGGAYGISPAKKTLAFKITLSKDCLSRA